MNAMKEKINSYQSELDKIQTVLDKLVTKQNSSVCDKLCVMTNSLFERIIDYKEEELTNEIRSGLIELLKRLREICVQLKHYQDYLIVTINDNIENLQNKEAIQNEPTGQQTQNMSRQLQYTSTPLASVMPINTNLKENQEKNAA